MQLQTDIYGIGQVVFVDNLLKAFILDYNFDQHHVVYYDVRYIVGSYVEKRVYYDRIRVCNIDSSSNNRSGVYRSSTIPIPNDSSRNETTVPGLANL